MLRLTYRNENIRVDAITQLFDNLVLPILIYGSEVWNPYTEQLEGDPIDQLFKAAQDKNNHMRMPTFNSVSRALGVHSKAMRIPVLAVLGRFPVSLKIVGQVITFWAHIVTADVGSYPRNIYNDMTEHQSTDKKLVAQLH